MIAMILAAGRGERMRPLTDTVPKPLLEVSGKPLIVHQIEALVLAGIKTIVINTGRLGEQIQYHLGTGTNFGVSILYSEEGDEPLETAGGIVKALPLLGNAPFIVTNADIYSNFDYQTLPKQLESDAHLVLVGNPSHNPEGDFAMEHHQLRNEGAHKLTYSGIGLYSPVFFNKCPYGKLALAPLLRQSAQENRLTGQHFTGLWNDIGTPERLAEINEINA
ncbi:MAG: mannose-1-phosphate guanylyltransferase [marine bacterium B5-7]|nr:MAG: mannose-1-phosphate guanylyltransferase [marine bacterium B5-7]